MTALGRVMRTGSRWEPRDGEAHNPVYPMGVRGVRKGSVRRCPFSREVLPALLILEGESGRELNRTAGDRCAGDLPHAWIGNPRGKRGWI
jgi:hypothetical protein